MSLDEHNLQLARDARLVLLSPRAAAAPLEGGLHTTTRDGARVATALWRTFAEPEGGGRLEVLTFVRSRLAAGPHRVTEAERVAEYLEQEARRALALRSLEVREGETSRDGAPIGQLTVEREAQLAAARPATMTLDSAQRSAKVVALGEHAATWSDLPDLDVAVIVYADRWGAPIELVAEPITA